MIIDLGYVLGIFELGRQAHLKDLQFIREPAENLILALGLKVPDMKNEPRLLQAVGARLETAYELRCLDVGANLALLQVATVGIRPLGASPKRGKELAGEAMRNIEDNLRSMGIMPSIALPADTVIELRRTLERGPGNGDRELSRFKVQVARAMVEMRSTERSEAKKKE